MEKIYENVKKLLHNEIETMIKKGSLTPAELDSLYKAIDVIKDLYEICEMSDAEEGYSERNYPWHRPPMNGYSGRMPYTYDDRYYDIHSYRGRNRDSMGRYSKEDAKTHMIDDLYGMMSDTSSEAERGAIQDCINRLKV